VILGKGLIRRPQAAGRVKRGTSGLSTIKNLARCIPERPFSGAIGTCAGQGLATPGRSADFLAHPVQEVDGT